jgi:hypothetical protein
VGHNRLGRLPKTERWNTVVGLLTERPADASRIAAATLAAAEYQLRDLPRQPALSYCFWLLTRITWAARSDDFIGELGRLGVAVEGQTSTLAFISTLADHVRGALASDTESGVFADLAALSLRRALSETAGVQSRSLFGSAVEDIQSSLRLYSTKDQFGAVSQRFFGDFLARTLTYFVDYEIGRVSALRGGMASGTEARTTRDAIDLHARQSARIVRDFAGGWYSKHNWESQGPISREQSDRFVAYALRKLRMELKTEAART